MVAIIDDEDFDRVSQHTWYAFPGRHTFYAGTNIRRDDRQVQLAMHRLLLGLGFGDKRFGDHVDGNGLNNRRQNIRIATRGQNGANRRSAKGSSSRFVGVSFNKYHKKWTAKIRTRWLGYFETEVEAAAAYNEAALHSHGEFARLNDLRENL